MKRIIYIITGCLILGICTIKVYNTTTKIKENNKLTEAQTVLNNAKNAYWDCLEYTSCNECTREYDNVKNAYDVFNKVNNI